MLQHVDLFADLLPVVVDFYFEYRLYGNQISTVDDVAQTLKKTLVLHNEGETQKRERVREKEVLKILTTDRLMPYGHGGEYWGRPVRDGCMQMPNRARPGSRPGAGVLSWSGARRRRRVYLHTRSHTHTRFLARFVTRLSCKISRQS